MKQKIEIVWGTEKRIFSVYRIPCEDELVEFEGREYVVEDVKTFLSDCSEPKIRLFVRELPRFPSDHSDQGIVLSGYPHPMNKPR